jgi:hypothetical protein
MNLKKVYSLECQICNVLHSLIADIYTYAPFKYHNERGCLKYGNTPLHHVLFKSDIDP